MFIVYIVSDWVGLGLFAEVFDDVFGGEFVDD
jgi:hypothetical protein